MGCYKLVSEPWFEGFGYALGCTWTQPGEMIFFLKKSEDKLLKSFFYKEEGGAMCAISRDQVSDSQITHTYVVWIICFIWKSHARVGLRIPSGIIW